MEDVQEESGRWFGGREGTRAIEPRADNLLSLCLFLFSGRSTSSSEINKYTEEKRNFLRQSKLISRSNNELNLLNRAATETRRPKRAQTSFFLIPPS